MLSRKSICITSRKTSHAAGKLPFVNEGVAYKKRVCAEGLFVEKDFGSEAFYPEGLDEPVGGLSFQDPLYAHEMHGIPVVYLLPWRVLA